MLTDRVLRKICGKGQTNAQFLRPACCTNTRTSRLSGCPSAEGWVALDGYVMSQAHSTSSHGEMYDVLGDRRVKHTEATITRQQQQH